MKEKASNGTVMEKDSSPMSTVLGSNPESISDRNSKQEEIRKEHRIPLFRQNT
jgi:hypothetical protein